MKRKLPVDLIEMVVMNYDGLPEALHGWRMYRIEYGGHAQNCIKEGAIWLPPQFDPRWLEKKFRTAQKVNRKG